MLRRRGTWGGEHVSAPPATLAHSRAGSSSTIVPERKAKGSSGKRPHQRLAMTKAQEIPRGPMPLAARWLAPPLGSRVWLIHSRGALPPRRWLARKETSIRSVAVLRSAVRVAHGGLTRAKAGQTDTIQPHASHSRISRPMHAGESKSPGRPSRGAKSRVSPTRPTTPSSPGGAGRGHYGLRPCTSTSSGRETKEVPAVLVDRDRRRRKA